MSLESSIFDSLKSLVSNRVYPDVAPISTALPYITYQQVGGRAVSFLESAVVGKRNARVQVNCWAATRLAASNLARSAEDALVVDTTCRAIPLAAMVATFEDETEPPLYGTRQDFSIWY